MYYKALCEFVIVCIYGAIYAPTDHDHHQKQTESKLKVWLLLL